MQSIQSTLQSLKRGLSTSVSPRKKVKRESIAFNSDEVIDLTWMDGQSGHQMVLVFHVSRGVIHKQFGIFVFHSLELMFAVYKIDDIWIIGD